MFVLLDAQQYVGRRNVEAWLTAASVPMQAWSELLAEADTLRTAGVKAHELLASSTPATNTILVCDPEDPWAPATTRLYRQSLVLSGPHYHYRIACANGLQCRNPAGMFTVHPTNLLPSKAAGKSGPTLCRFCRHSEGMPRASRERIGQCNRDRRS